MAPKTAEGDEAAAIAAAVARFEAELGGAPAEPPQELPRWQRVALLEGVSAKEIVLDAEGGGPKWLS